MEGEDQKESVQPEKQSESLKAFSDAELLDELKKRLINNPSVDPVMVQDLQSTVVELQKKAEATKSLQAEPEKLAEYPPAVDPKLEDSVESSVESEGKKWARIIREKGVGILDGKFGDWRYLDEGGNFIKIPEHVGKEFKTAGLFGNKDDSDRRLANCYDGRAYFKMPGSDIITFSEVSKKANRANFLQLRPLDERKDRFSHGVITRYTSWIDPRSTFDHRGPARFYFTFVLPEKEGDEFFSACKKNFDLIEEVFQSVYPGLTGKNGARRMITDRLKVIVPQNSKNPTEVRFSHPVGETQWSESIYSRKRF